MQKQVSLVIIFLLSLATSAPLDVGEISEEPILEETSVPNRNYYDTVYESSPDETSSTDVEQDLSNNIPEYDGYPDSSKHHYDIVNGTTAEHISTHSYNLSNPDGDNMFDDINQDGNLPSRLPETSNYGNQFTSTSAQQPLPHSSTDDHMLAKMQNKMKNQYGVFSADDEQVLPNRKSDDKLPYVTKTGDFDVSSTDEDEDGMEAAESAHRGWRGGHHHHGYHHHHDVHHHVYIHRRRPYFG